MFDTRFAQLKVALNIYNAINLSQIWGRWEGYVNVELM